VYDIAIIGAGINGCSVAYEFTQEGKKVILFDMEKIANGGSGAAGAFIAPKFSKVGELKELLHDAFLYSMDYYDKHFPHLIQKSSLLHIAKDKTDGETLKLYKEKTSLHLLTPLDEDIKELAPQVASKEIVSLNAAVVNAEYMCQAMAKSAKFVKQEVKNLVYNDGFWVIDETYSAKEVVLATGAYEKVINEPYINIRGIWGHRIDVQTTTINKNSLHQFVSISATHEGKLAIGATHDVHYHPQTSKEPYNIELGRKELLHKASQTLKLDNIKILKDFTGLRSGASDYLPLIGALVMSKETLNDANINFQTKKPDYDAYTYYPHLTMINGSGGYGFVLAPYLAKILKEYILKDIKIDKKMLPARFFYRFAKKKF
jgi:tRNA 5-methylaminomethyl-2-thiouridine biosynthesis bifunctional protein